MGKKGQPTVISNDQQANTFNEGAHERETQEIKEFRRTHQLSLYNQANMPCMFLQV